MSPSSPKCISPTLPSPYEFAPPITPDELTASLPAGSKVLDIGCGSGSFNYSARPDIEIHCCDILPPSPVPALPNVQYRQVSADSLDYQPGSFDLLIMNFVLEHTEKPAHIIKLAHSILKSDGVLYISVPIASHYEDRSFRAYDRFLKILTLHPFDRIEHFQHFSENKIFSIAIESGFTPIAKSLVPAGFGWIYGNIEGLSKTPGIKSRVKLSLCRWNLFLADIWLKFNHALYSNDPRYGANILCTFRKSPSPPSDPIRSIIQNLSARHFTHSCGHCGLPINIQDCETRRKSGVTQWKCPRCGNLNIL
ncbi:MAG: class I SAM-dependent methyltransferase [bacterium]|nr:class I SAM-dependent methyltransferase [bacterium]